MKFRIISSLLAAYICLSCTPFDSNSLNKELLQGRWILTDVKHSVYDSVALNYSEEQTFLLFSGDSCIQLMPHFGDTTAYSYAVNGYRLGLFIDSVAVNRYSIDLLTKDSLVLSRKGDERIYIKIEQE